MKIKALKPHYYEGSYINEGLTYSADKVHADFTVRRGICEEIPIAKPKKGRPPRKKQVKG